MKKQIEVEIKIREIKTGNVVINYDSEFKTLRLSKYTLEEIFRQNTKIENGEIVFTWIDEKTPNANYDIIFSDDFEHWFEVRG